MCIVEVVRALQLVNKLFRKFSGSKSLFDFFRDGIDKVEKMKPGFEHWLKNACEMKTEKYLCDCYCH